MPKSLLNYTTKVEAPRTVSQIQEMLVEAGARALLSNYDAEGHIESLSFQIMTSSGLVGFRLPVNPDAVYKVLLRQHARSGLVTHPQSVRVAWRIVKDWVEAQLAIIQTEMVRAEQVFLPYATTPSGKTVYEVLVERRFKLLEAGTEATDSATLNEAEKDELANAP